MRAGSRPGTAAPAARGRDDAGGVWILTGWVLGALVYAGCVLMAVAGFAAVLPLVVVPPVLLVLIGSNNLFGGGRSYGRAKGRPGESPEERGGTA